MFFIVKNFLILGNYDGIIIDWNYGNRLFVDKFWFVLGVISVRWNIFMGYVIDIL